VLKMNSLQDEEIIQLLYEAGKAGVRVKLIIRGICCLIPGQKGASENIEGISIVDRYLEHSRVFIFHNDGNPEVYLSSADWMVRNLHFRVETLFPVLDTELVATIINCMHMQLNDNVKARILDAKNANMYKKIKDDIAVRSQVETYYFIKRREEIRTQSLRTSEN
jgi:polyphosphate kinase